MKMPHSKIRDWYNRAGRKGLPWRSTSDPYAIYISEIMLQQTQVKTVLERFYFPFLERFPTLKALSEASLDEVLKMWEGLGYYRRAKYLHATACQVKTLPDSIDALMKLPGIGKNTAHALAAFAFHAPVPVMEANVKRILCRLYALENPSEALLWKHAYALVDTHEPFVYNQAMMDIGALLCKPKNPRCDACPLKSVCQGTKNAEHYPQTKKKAVPVREEFIMLSLYGNKLAMQQRQGKFLHGLWGFPSVEVPLCASEYIGEVRHAYTHFKLINKVYLYDALEEDEAMHYFSLDDIQNLAISKVDEKIVKLYKAYLST